MNHPERSIISIHNSTIGSHYRQMETVTSQNAVEPTAGYRVLDEEGRTVSVPFSANNRVRHSSDQVRVRVRDLVRGLQRMASSQLAWLDDLGDDPIVLTRDFYEVFLTCQQIRRSA
jgi:hypothetical protein